MDSEAAEPIHAERWTIYIDIEGFSSQWEQGDDALCSLSDLMLGIHRIGTRCYPEEPDRLFAHQYGDGFAIVSSFHEQSLTRCVCIAVALMRHVAAGKCFARAGIAEGQMADITGCYPQEVLADREGNRTVDLGGGMKIRHEEGSTVRMRAGLMTINSVMGSGLIRANKVDKLAPRGPLLSIQTAKAHRIGDGFNITRDQRTEVSVIDWVHAASPTIQHIQSSASLRAPDASTLEKSLLQYCGEQSVPDEWRTSVRDFLRIPGLCLQTEDGKT